MDGRHDSISKRAGIEAISEAGEVKDETTSLAEVSFLIYIAIMVVHTDNASIVCIIIETWHILYSVLWHV